MCGQGRSFFFVSFARLYETKVQSCLKNMQSAASDGLALRVPEPFRKVKAPGSRVRQRNVLKRDCFLFLIGLFCICAFLFVRHPLHRPFSLALSRPVVLGRDVLRCWLGRGWLANSARQMPGVGWGEGYDLACTCSGLMCISVFFLSFWGLSLTVCNYTRVECTE